MSNTIGIVGQGFVGSAIKVGLKDFYDIFTYDLQENLRNCDSLCELVEKSKFIFVCLPTPMNDNGSCNLLIIEQVLGVLNQYYEDCENIIVIKSTIPPGATEDFNKKYENINIVFNIKQDPNTLESVQVEIGE